MDNSSTSKCGTDVLKKFKCKKCPKSYSHQESLRRHVREHHEAKRYTCSQCPKTFGRSDLLKIHFRTHSGEKPYTCTLCPKAFAQLPDLKKHIRSQLGERHYKCSNCDSSFIRAHHLQKHIEVLHSAVKPFKCDDCGDSFAIKLQLRRHQKIDSIQTACEACEKTFTSSECFYSHRNQHIKSGMSLGAQAIEKLNLTKSQTILQCESCSYNTRRINSFTKHKQTHEIGYQVECHCGMTFDTKKKLERHKRKHLTFPCDMCKRVFTSKDSLFIHIRSHLQLKTEKCKICQKSFSDGTSLKCHMLIHSGVKAFSCKFCGRTFTQSSNMKTHVNIVHKKQVKKFCVFCDKGVYSNQELFSHILSHINERPYYCTGCQREFSNLQNKRTHKCWAKSRLIKY